MGQWVSGSVGPVHGSMGQQREVNRNAPRGSILPSALLAPCRATTAAQSLPAVVLASVMTEVTVDTLIPLRPLPSPSVRVPRGESLGASPSMPPVLRIGLPWLSLHASASHPRLPSHGFTPIDHPRSPGPQHGNSPRALFLQDHYCLGGSIAAGPLLLATSHAIQRAHDFRPLRIAIISMHVMLSVT